MKPRFKKHKAIGVLVIVLLSAALVNSQTLQKTIITGVVKDSTIKSLLLLKTGEDLRFGGLEIPINNAAFNYELDIEYAQGYKLMLGSAKQRGGGRFMTFFMEPGEVKFTVFFEEKFDKNTIAGGMFNRELRTAKNVIRARFYDKMKPYSDSLEILMEHGEFHSDAMKTVMKELETAESQEIKFGIYEKMDALQKANLHLSDKAKKINDKQLIILDESKTWIENYISENTSLVAYDFLLNNLLRDHEKEISYNTYLIHYNKFAKQYPKHPYTKKVKNILESYKAKEGGRFVDFSAPDLEGKLFALSNEIKGKIAVINLWATWCGPCIVKSKKLTPIYNKYKDKGFTLVGVAGEFKSTDRLKRFLATENYPWLNLVELDKQNNIWDK